VHVNATRIAVVHLSVGLDVGEPEEAKAGGPQRRDARLRKDARRATTGPTIRLESAPAQPGSLAVASALRDCTPCERGRLASRRRGSGA
jgi:hypothetical protein